MDLWRTDNSSRGVLQSVVCLECNLETSTMRRPRLIRTFEPLKNMGLVEVTEFRSLAFRQLVVVSG